MSIFDDLSAGWDQLNQGLADTGILQAINPIARDVIPFLGGAEDLLGLDPNAWGTARAPVANAGGISGLARPQITGAGIPVFAGGQTGGGGASMDYSGGFLPATSSGRMPMIIPYGGGMIPRGYRVKNMGQRNPNAGRAAGTYLVRSRRMNPLNPRALLRAEHRMSSFTHWVTRHFRIQHAMPKRKHKGGRFRRKR